MIFALANIIQSKAISPLSDNQYMTLWQKADSEYMVGDWQSAQEHYRLALETANRNCADKNKIIQLSIRLASSYAYQNQLPMAEPIYQQLISNTIKLNDKNSGLDSSDNCII